MPSIGNSKPVIVVLIVLAALVFVILQGLNFLASDPANSFAMAGVARQQGKLTLPGHLLPLFIMYLINSPFAVTILLIFLLVFSLFSRGISNVSALYPLEITPIGATFAIWGVIYAWQAAIVIYSLAAVCRVTPAGPVYCNPTLLSPIFYSVYILNSFANITWLFLWDNLYITISSVFLFVTAITLYICLYISYSRLDKYKGLLIERGRKGEIYLIIFIVQNGIAIYATWTSIASLINLGVALSYSDNRVVTPETASTIGLAILAVGFIAFVGLDLSILNRYSRYVFTPYFVVPIALVGIIAKNWDPTETNSIFTAVLLSVSLVAAVLKAARLAGCCQGNKDRYMKATLDDDYRPLK